MNAAIAGRIRENYPFGRLDRRLGLSRDELVVIAMARGWRIPDIVGRRSGVETGERTALIRHFLRSRRSPILGDVLCSASVHLPAETQNPDGVIPTTCGRARGRTMPGAAAGNQIMWNITLRFPYSARLRPSDPAIEAGFLFF